MSSTALEEARRRDAADPLRSFIEEFHHPVDPAGRRLIYLCGHSLGLQSRSTAAYVEQELADWRRLAVAGHHDARRPWIDYHERAAPGLALLTGASESEVIAMNSLTVNLHLMMASFFRPGGARTRVLIEAGAFPSDRYAIAAQLAWHGLEETHLIEASPRAGERCLRTEDILALIAREGPRLALVLWPGVQYLTGQSFDLPSIIAAARAVGAAVGLDLAHAIGNVPLALHDDGADFAVWCSYKYLNAGPGAIGGCFVHARHARRRDLPRLAGWWGHDAAHRFEMRPQFEPMPGAAGWQVSNPPILSTAPLLASLELFARADPARLSAKSHALTACLEQAINERLGRRVEIITPAAPEARGAQLSVRLDLSRERAQRCHELLKQAGVIHDWREPDVLRLAPVPLYNSFEDVIGAAAALEAALAA
jgi:kynureninase